MDTDVGSEQDFYKYCHSNAFHDFNTDLSDQPMTFFRFKLERQIDFKNESFSIQVSQQGDRLGKYKLSSGKFEPSRFNILLGKSDGPFIKATLGDEFLLSLNNENVVMTPGEYIVMVDPIWNDSASQDKLHKKILVDVCCRDRIEIEPIDDNTGMKALELMLKNFAQNMQGDGVREYYLEQVNSDYADVYRIEDVSSTGCWYGFFYTRNDSAFDLCETFTPDF